MIEQYLGNNALINAFDKPDTTFQHYVFSWNNICEGWGL